MPDEIEWRVVPGTNVEVNDAGEVRTVGSLRVRRLSVGGNGYYYVNVLGRSRKVAGLVCAAFHGERPLGQEVRHLNGNALDDRPANLAWGTHLENEADKRAHGTHHLLRRSHCVNGHEFTPENTRIGKTLSGTRRVCRTCVREESRRRLRG